MSRNYILISLGFSLLFSCSREKEVKNFAEIKYFDLKAYFAEEALTLQKLNPSVSKTVVINGEAEHKVLKIKNWEQELSIFSDADINKTAWIGKFKTIKTDSSTTYLSNDEKISVKKLFVKSLNQEVKEIVIISANKNLVFNTNDTLIYTPKKSYQINKHQKIKLVKEKIYQIKAEIEKP